MLALILAECDAEQVDAYTRFCAVLAAFAESDFNPDAVQGGSVGVYQQTLPWWTNDRHDVRSACRAFIADFARNAYRHTGRPVVDCWFTQQWLAPDPTHDPIGFWSARETVNYSNRVAAVVGMGL